MISRTAEKLYASNLALYALIFIASIAVYLNTTLNGFVWDDGAMVVANEHIRSLGPSSLKLFFTSGKAHNHAIGEIYRPLSLVSYAIDYKLFGLNPAGFHATNVLLHAINSALVFGLMLLIIGDRAASLAAALVFAVHPIHTEAVAWIKDRDDLLSLLFMLLAFYHYAKARGAWKGIAVSLGLFALALSAKEMAIVLPPLLALYIICFQPEKIMERETYIKLLPFFIMTGAYFFVRTLVLGQVAQGAYMGGGLYPAMLTMSRGVAYYMKLLVMPTGLSADYATFVVSHSVSLGVIGSIILILAVVAAGAFAHAFSRPFSFGVFWFFIALIPVSNVIPVKIPIAERFLYTPSIGFSIVLGVVVAWGLKRRGSRRTASLAVLMILLALYSIGTIKRNAVWKDGLTLFSDVLEKHPDNLTAHINVGNHYFNLGDMPKALAHYETAASINPYDSSSLESVASVLERTVRIKEARVVYEKAVDAAKNHPDRTTHDFSVPSLLYSLGRALRKEGRVDDAISTELEAIGLDPALADAHVELGGLYIMKGDWQSAEAALSRALELRPGDKTALLSLGYAYVGAGDCERAGRALGELSRIDPQNERARELIASCKPVTD
jgi:tetratricopeptide (TPR) repeat protein